MVKHSQRKHALLSASGAHRWLNCPPSAVLNDKYEDKGSIYAQEGTLAHELADYDLRIASFVGPNAEKAKLRTARKALTRHELYDPDMEQYVDVYVHFVLETWGANGDLLIEEKTDFSHIVPDGFGTSDANIVRDGTLYVNDLKYGKGVKVMAEKNEQLGLYAVGLLRKYSLIYDIHRVVVTIIQPRLDHIDSYTYKVEDLLTWSKDVVKPIAEQAIKGEGEMKVGDWCRWCRHKVKCRAYADENLKLAKLEFADPKTLTDDEVAQAYSKIELIGDWLKSVKDHMQTQAIANGKKWPGFKLVEGRSVRKWKNPDKAVTDIVENAGVLIDDVVNTKIKGIGEIEKLIGKEKLNELDLLEKPPGAPTLVSEKDKRPEWQSAQIDFK